MSDWLREGWEERERERESERETEGERQRERMMNCRSFYVARTAAAAADL